MDETIHQTTEADASLAASPLERIGILSQAFESWARDVERGASS